MTIRRASTIPPSPRTRHPPAPPAPRTRSSGTERAHPPGHPPGQVRRLHLLLPTSYFLPLTSYLGRYAAFTDLAGVRKVMTYEQTRAYVTPNVLLSIIVTTCVLGVAIFCGVLLAVQLTYERLRIARESALQRLPRIREWILAPGQTQVCFLSHHKADAGAHARYLHDALEYMLSADVYLDSSELTELRLVFTQGVRKSEVMVVLLTEGLLSRPWCLLEVYEATKLRKPVILLMLKGKGFGFEDARNLLSNLETELPLRNPNALEELRAQLGSEPLSRLQVRARARARAGARARV